MKKRPLTKFRLALWFVGFACLACVLYTYTPPHLRPWNRFLPPDYRAYASNGKALISAVYKFRNQRGLWPQEGEDLIPGFIAKIPDGWQYTTKNGWPQVIESIGGKEYVGYDFDPKHNGYFAWGNLLDQKIDLPVAIPAAPALAREELEKRILAEYDRRLKATPDLPENWQAKGAYLYQIGRKEELAAFLMEAEEFRPFNFWPRIAAAKMELDAADKTNLSKSIGNPFRYLPARPEAPATVASNTVPASTTTAPASTVMAPASTLSAPPATQPAPQTAGEKFVAWSVAHPSFTHYFYVCAYARWVGDDAAAIRAAELAMTRKIETADEDYPFDRYYFLYRLARFSYQARQYPLCLLVCGEWVQVDQQDRKKHGPGNRSYYPFAAAANLALGEFDLAISLSQQCGVADYQGPPLMARNYDPLADAAKRHDTKFVYVPNPDGGEPEYDPFTRYDR